LCAVRLGCRLPVCRVLLLPVRLLSVACCPLRGFPPRASLRGACPFFRLRVIDRPAKRPHHTNALSHRTGTLCPRVAHQQNPISHHWTGPLTHRTGTLCPRMRARENPIGHHWTDPPGPIIATPIKQNAQNGKKIAKPQYKQGGILSPRPSSKKSAKSRPPRPGKTSFY